MLGQVKMAAMLNLLFVKPIFTYEPFIYIHIKNTDRAVRKNIPVYYSEYFHLTTVPLLISLRF